MFNSQKNNLSWLVFLFSVLIIVSVKTTMVASEMPFDEQDSLSSLFHQFRLSLPPLILAQAPQTTLVVVGETLTISLEQLNPHNRDLALLIQQNPRIRQVRIINPGSRLELSSDQVDLLGMYFHTIESLNLEGVNASLNALAALHQFRELRELNLANNNIDSAQLKYLAHSLDLPNLETLNLSDNPIGNEGLAALSTFTFAPLLRSLALANTGISSEGLVDKQVINVFIHLQALDLSNNPLGNDGFTALAQASFAPFLESLTVANAGIIIQQLKKDVLDSFVSLKTFYL